MHQLKIRLTDDQYEELRERAYKEKRSMSEIVVEAMFSAEVTIVKTRLGNIAYPKNPDEVPDYGGPDRNVENRKYKMPAAGRKFKLPDRKTMEKGSSSDELPFSKKKQSEGKL